MLIIKDLIINIMESTKVQKDTLNHNKSFKENDNNPKLWCVHNGQNTHSNQCPYTKKVGIKCSMPHIDQPNGVLQNY